MLYIVWEPCIHRLFGLFIDSFILSTIMSRTSLCVLSHTNSDLIPSCIAFVYCAKWNSCMNKFIIEKRYSRLPNTTCFDYITASINVVVIWHHWFSSCGDGCPTKVPLIHTFFHTWSEKRLCKLFDQQNVIFIFKFFTHQTVSSPSWFTYIFILSFNSDSNKMKVSHF